MGFNSALNLACQGFCVAGYDVDERKVAALAAAPSAAGCGGRQASSTRCSPSSSGPRRIILRAAEFTESIIAELAPRLQGAGPARRHGQLLLQGYRAPAARAGRGGFVAHRWRASPAGTRARRRALHHAGGRAGRVERMAPPLAAAAAKVDGVPCTVYIGPGAGPGTSSRWWTTASTTATARWIAEACHILRELLGLAPAELAPVFAEWDRGRAELVPSSR